MYIDQQAELSDAQAVTGTTISTNVLDLLSGAGGGIALGGGNVRMDAGNELYLLVRTIVAATDTGSDATLTITLESADDAALTTNAQVHFSSGPIAFTNYSAAGTNLVAVRLGTAAFYRRYLGVRYTVANGPLTAGAFDAVLTPSLGGFRIYKSAFAVQ